jgi:hypothetical protein
MQTAICATHKDEARRISELEGALKYVKLERDAAQAAQIELERELGDYQTQEAVHREFAEGWARRISDLEAALARRDALLREAKKRALRDHAFNKRDDLAMRIDAELARKP